MAGLWLSIGRAAVALVTIVALAIVVGLVAVAVLYGLSQALGFVFGLF